MTINGNHNNVPTIPMQPIATDKQLFELNGYEISQYVKQKFFPFDKSIPELADLLQNLISLPEHSNEEKKRILVELKNVIPLKVVLDHLMDTQPRQTIEILEILDDKNATFFFVKFYIENHQKEPNSFFLRLFKFILEEFHRKEDQKLWMNRTINSIPLINIHGIYSELVQTTPLSELGQIAGLIKDEENSKPLVTEILKFHFTNEKTEELSIMNCAVFIDQVCLAIDKVNPQKPQVLILFLKALDSAGKLQSYIIEPMDVFFETNLLHVLWALPPEGISDYVSTINLMENPYHPAELLTELFKLEKNPDCRAALIDEFTECLSENELQLFLSALGNINSCVIPYLLVGLNDDNLEELAINVSIPIIDRLLKNAMPATETEMHWLVERLCAEQNRERLSYICEEVSFDKISQDLEIRDNVIITNYLTLQKVCDIIKANKEDLDNILNHIQKDIEDIPPILIACGIHHPEYRNQILLASKLLTEEQLKAISMSFSKEVLCERLDELFNFLLVDQIFFVLNSLSMKLGAVYTLYKTEQILDLYMEIIENQKIIKEEMSSLDNNPDLQDGIIEHNKKIRKILTPVNLQLRKVLRSYTPYMKLFFEIPPLFPSMIDLCQTYLKNIEGPKGYLQKIKNSIPKTKSNSSLMDVVVGKKNLDALKLESIEQLKPLGIYRMQDLSVLGILTQSNKLAILKMYLDQEELEPIWEFLNTKKFYALSAIVESCLIEDNEDLFNLKPLAIKLGYIPKT
jgi:hypothetical protein